MDALTGGITGTVDYLSHLLDILGAFFSQRPILGVVLLGVLVCLVGWECTHPPRHQEDQ